MLAWCRQASSGLVEASSRAWTASGVEKLITSYRPWNSKIKKIQEMIKNLNFQKSKNIQKKSKIRGEPPYFRKKYIFSLNIFGFLENSGFCFFVFFNFCFFFMIFHISIHVAVPTAVPPIKGIILLTLLDAGPYATPRVRRLTLTAKAGG